MAERTWIRTPLISSDMMRNKVGPQGFDTSFADDHESRDCIRDALPEMNDLALYSIKLG
jgi:hypothetical protein